MGWRWYDWCIAALMCALVAYMAVSITGAGSSYSNAKHCREVLEGIPFKTADYGVVCVPKDALLRVY